MQCRQQKKRKDGQTMENTTPVMPHETLTDEAVKLFETLSPAVKNDIIELIKSLLSGQ